MKKFIVFIIILITFSTQSFASEVLEDNVNISISKTGGHIVYMNSNRDVNTEIISQEDVNISFSLLGDLDIKSDCVLMVERNSGEILYQKKAYEKMYPASTTKILTAILVLEKCPLNEIATVNVSALNAVPATYATAQLKAG